jgi:gamma-glutamylputrescine synthase
MLYGLEHSLPLPPAACGNGYENDDAAVLPLSQQQALTLFHQCPALRENLGPAFTALWHTCKTAELHRFEGQVTAAEISWML